MTATAETMGLVTAIELAAALLLVAHTTIALPPDLRPWVTRCRVDRRSGVGGITASSPAIGAACVAVVSWFGTTITPQWAWGMLASLVLLFVGVLVEPTLHRGVERRRNTAE
jgi:hypothetical protein